LIECGGAPLFANTPFHAAAQMLDQATAGPDPETRLARLEATAELAGANRQEAAVLFAELLGLELPASYAPLGLLGEQKRERLFAALVAWILAEAARQPLILVVEDLHWLDPSTLELLQILADQGSSAPLFLLCTTRPEFRPPWPSRPHHLQIV